MVFPPHMFPILKRYDWTLPQLRAASFFPLLTPQQKLAHIDTVTNAFNSGCIFLEIEAGEIPMARKKLNQFSTKFAAVKLSVADRKKFQDWKKDNGADGDVLYTELVRGGWKGSQSYDQENDCFIWSMTQRNERDINYDVCVTSRSDNMYEAMLLGIYKLLVLYPDQALPTESPRDNWG